MRRASDSPHVAYNRHALPLEQILLVEDDKANALVACTILRLLGYRFDWVKPAKMLLRLQNAPVTASF